MNSRKSVLWQTFWVHRLSINTLDPADPCLFSTNTLLFPRPQVKLTLSCSTAGYACQGIKKAPSGWSLVLQKNNSYSLPSHFPGLMWTPQSVPSWSLSLSKTLPVSQTLVCADNLMFNYKTHLREDQENCLQTICSSSTPNRPYTTGSSKLQPRLNPGCAPCGSHKLYPAEHPESSTLTCNHPNGRCLDTCIKTQLQSAHYVSTRAQKTYYSRHWIYQHCWSTRK